MSNQIILNENDSEIIEENNIASFADNESLLNKLDVNYSHRRWSYKEHEIFIRSMLLYDCNWSKIAQEIPSRSEKDIKTHLFKYFSHLLQANTKREHNEINESNIVFTKEQIEKLSKDEMEHILINKLKQNKKKYFNVLQNKCFDIQKNTYKQVQVEEKQNVENKNAIVKPSNNDKSNCASSGYNHLINLNEDNEDNDDNCYDNEEEDDEEEIEEEDEEKEEEFNNDKSNMISLKNSSFLNANDNAENNNCENKNNHSWKLYDDSSVNINSKKMKDLKEMSEVLRILNKAAEIIDQLPQKNNHENNTSCNLSNLNDNPKSKETNESRKTRNNGNRMNNNNHASNMSKESIRKSSNVVPSSMNTRKKKLTEMKDNFSNKNCKGIIDNNHNDNINRRNNHIENKESMKIMNTNNNHDVNNKNLRLLMKNVEMMEAKKNTLNNFQEIPHLVQQQASFLGTNKSSGNANNILQGYHQNTQNLGLEYNPNQSIVPLMDNILHNSIQQQQINHIANMNLYNPYLVNIPQLNPYFYQFPNNTSMMYLQQPHIPQLFPQINNINNTVNNRGGMPLAFGEGVGFGMGVGQFPLLNNVNLPNLTNPTQMPNLNFNLNQALNQNPMYEGLLRLYLETYGKNIK